MASPPLQAPKSSSIMAKSLKPSLFSDGLLFFGGAATALLVFFTFSSFFSPSPFNNSNNDNDHRIVQSQTDPRSSNLRFDPSISNFYDDPSLSYTVTQDPIQNWDEKRLQWLESHPSLNKSGDRILMVSGSQPGPCRNPIGDHLLLKFMKNKLDYCRLHGIDFFYNTALLQPQMFSFWAKIPVVRAAMVAHPEAEWIWWVDSDAAFTDVEFQLPLHRYADYNLVLHGWPDLVYNKKSWTSLNAGVFLMRNCQWSIDFIARWSKMGPQSREYAEWGRIQRSIFKDKLYKESDDQTGIAYLLLKEKERWGSKVHLESEFYFEGYWLEIVHRLEKIEEEHLEAEKKVAELRKRCAERDVVASGRLREGVLAKRGVRKRPFITHFTGCQPCSGDHNKEYSGENCYEGMQKTLNFADNQVLRAYGFRHQRLVNSTGVRPLPFDFPRS